MTVLCSLQNGSCTPSTKNKYVQGTSFKEIDALTHIKDLSVINILTQTHIVAVDGQGINRLHEIMDVFLLTNSGSLKKVNNSACLAFSRIMGNVASRTTASLVTVTSTPALFCSFSTVNLFVWIICNCLQSCVIVVYVCRHWLFSLNAFAVSYLKIWVCNWSMVIRVNLKIHTSIDCIFVICPIWLRYLARYNKLHVEPAVKYRLFDSKVPVICSASGVSTISSGQFLVSGFTLFVSDLILCSHSMIGMFFISLSVVLLAYC